MAAILDFVNFHRFKALEKNVISFFSHHDYVPNGNKQKITFNKHFARKYMYTCIYTCIYYCCCCFSSCCNNNNIIVHSYFIIVSINWLYSTVDISCYIIV